MLVFLDRRIASRLPPAPPQSQYPSQGRQASSAAATAFPAEHRSNASDDIGGTFAAFGDDASIFAGSSAAVSLLGGRRQGSFSARPAMGTGCSHSAPDPGIRADHGAGPLGWPAAQHAAAAAAAAGAADRHAFNWARAPPPAAAADGGIGLRAGSDSALSPRIFGARPAAKSSCNEPQDAPEAPGRPAASCPDSDPFRGDWPHW